MSLIFWRRTTRNAEGKENEATVPTSLAYPFPVHPTIPDEYDALRIKAEESRAFIGKTGGDPYRSTATLIRPGNATQFAAGDVFGDISGQPLYFPNVGIYGGGGALWVDTVCIDNTSESTKPNLRLYLYDSLVAMQADNAAWAPTDDDETRSLAYCEFTNWEVGSGNSKSFARPSTGTALLTCVHGQTGIWGVVVERGTYTPVAQERLTIRLGLLRFA